MKFASRVRNWREFWWRGRPRDTGAGWGGWAAFGNSGPIVGGVLVVGGALWGMPIAMGLAGEQFCARAWTVADGLPGNTVFCLAQTADGYLWLGTAYGLTRFDGARFARCELPRRSAAASTAVYSVSVDRGGALWTGSARGEVARWAGGGFENLPVPDDVRAQVYSIAEEGTNLWVGFGVGLARYAGDRLARTSLRPQELLGSFKRVVERPAHPGQPWVHFNDSLCALAGEKLERIAPPPATTSEPVLGIEARRAGGLWVVFASGVTWLAENGQWGVLHRFGGLPVGWAVTVTEDRRGNLWLGTPLRGLFCLSSEGQMRNLLETGEVPFTWIRQVIEDRQGNLFLATDANGLVRISRRAFRLWGAPEDGPPTAVNSVAPAFDGGVWIGTNGKGLFHLTPAGRFEHLTVLDESTVAFAQTLREDKRKRLWVGTYDQGLFCFDATEGTLLRRWYDPDIWSEVRALAEDDTGLWASTFLGVYHGAPDGEWRRASAVKARALAPGAAHRCWAGLPAEPGASPPHAGPGVMDLRVALATASSREAAEAPPALNTTAILEDRRGLLWVGTDGGGLWFRRGNHWQSLGPAEGLASPHVSGLVEDASGYIWVSSPAGLARLDPRGVEAGSAADRPVPCVVLGGDQGLETLAYEGGSQPRACRTSDGRLWFATLTGLLEVDPARVAPAPPPGAPHIESVQVNGRELFGRPVPASPPRARLEIPPGAKRVVVGYTAVNFVRGAQTRFRTRLEGLQTAWEDAGTGRAAQYGDLRPGHYTFLVSARSPEGGWVEASAALALDVQPFLWQTRWFQGGVALASLVATAGAARWLSYRRLRARLEQLQWTQAVQRERERIARDMHDHLGASLTRLALLSAGAAPATTGEQKLRLEVGSVVRESARALEEIVWAVNPRNDTVHGLADYLSLMVDECFGETPVRCRQDLPVQVSRRALSARVRHNIILLFREAFHNTLRHARATEARLALRLAGDRLEIDWTDNGCGFDLQAPRAIEADGLENMGARASELGARLEFQSAPEQGLAIRFALRLPPDGSEPEPTDAP